MSKRMTYRLLMLTLVCGGVLSQAYAQELVLRTSVFSAGAQQSTVDNLVLQNTVGQPFVYPAQGSGFELQGGFWSQVANGFPVPLAVPTAAPDAATTDEDTAVEIDVLANDTDPAGGTLTIIDFGTPEHGQALQSGEGTFTYTPDADFFGDDGFVYSIQNEQGGRSEGTVTITVNPVNDAPIFTSTPVAAAVIDTEYRYLAKATDVDLDALTFTALVLPPWLALVEQTDTTATLVGTPTAAEAGAHAVTLSASDGVATVEQAFTITVTADVPVAPVLLAPEDGAIVDPTNGVPLAWQAVSGAASYRLDLATVEDFSTLVSGIGGITDTTWTLHALQDNTLYFWRIRAANSLGTSDPGAPFRFSTGMNVATEDAAGEIPAQFDLHQNYPNPFNPTTTIAYDVPEATEIRLVVYDLFGRAVKTLVEARRPAGRYTVTFEAGDLASGTYFYRIEAGSFTQTRQLLLLK